MKEDIGAPRLSLDRWQDREDILSPSKPKPRANLRYGNSVLLALMAAVVLAYWLHPACLVAASTISYVQGNSATPRSHQTTVNVTFTAAQAAGDLNVVVVGWTDSTAPVNAVTDTRGNTYTRAVGPTVTSGYLSQSIYYAKKIAAAAAGANTVTVTFAAAAAYPDIRILEYSGADPSNPVDVTAASSGNSASTSSGSATTTSPTDLIFGANTVFTLTTGPGSGFTQRLLTPDGNLAEDKVATTAGSYSATAPLSSSGPWIMQMVAFRTIVPPTAPSNVIATAVSTSQINLSWTASTSSVGLANYLVERCQGTSCTNFAQIASQAGTTYNDTGLASNATYSYRLRAIDTAGTFSSYSNVASATTSVAIVSAITYVQGNYATPQSPQTTVNVTFTAAQAAGHLNVVVVGWNDSTATVSAVSDTRGNTYTRAVGPTVISGYLSQSIYYARNIASAAAGVNTVTVTFSRAAVYPDIRILEYSGADSRNPIDASAASSGSSTTSSSGSATTTNPTDLIFGANTVFTLTTGPGSGFTQRLLTPDGNLAEDKVATTAGSYSATAPLSSSGPWIMQMVAFRTASGAIVPPTAPSNVIATAVSASQINLGWTASTSSVGLANYLVERCQGTSCTNFAQIASQAGTTYNDTGLASNATYSYRLRAIDTAGTFSSYSNVASATTSVAIVSAITYVQGNYATPQSPQTTVNVTFTATQAAGHLNVVVVGWNDSTATVSAVSDTRGNTYTRAVGPTVISGYLSQSIYYAKNIAAAAAGANTVTVTFATAASYPDIRILEYSGADPSNPVDVTAASSGSSTASSSGSATTTNPTDLIFGANTVFTLTTGPGSGFTQRLLTTGRQHCGRQDGDDGGEL